MSTAQPFNPRLVVGMIVAGIVAFGAMLLLIAFGQNIGADRQGRAHALSVAAVGYKGLYRLTGEYDETLLVRETLQLDTPNLLVVALEDRSDPDRVRALLTRRRALPTLLILPKWATRPSPVRRGWVEGMFPGLGADAAGALGEGMNVRPIGGARLPGEAAGVGVLDGMRFRMPRTPQVIEGPGLVPLVPLDPPPQQAGGKVAEAVTAPAPPPAGKPAAGEGADAGPSLGPALVARIGDAPHYVVADPDLLNNHGLRDPAAARAAVALLERLSPAEADGIWFDLTVNGLGGEQQQSMLRLAFEPPFLAMTLAVVLAAILAGLHGAFRFGPVRRPERAIAFGKATLVENSAGLIRLADREAALGGAYADVVRHEVGRAVHAPPALQGEELDLYLDRVARPGSAPFSELAAEVAAASDRHGLMAAAKRLFQWRREVVR